MWMTIITCVGLPLVLVYHVIIYRTFRGRVKEEDLAHYQSGCRSSYRSELPEPSKSDGLSYTVGNRT